MFHSPNDTPVAPAPVPASTAKRVSVLRTRLQGLRARARASLVFMAGIAAALIGLVLYNTLYPPPKPLTQKQVNDTVAQAMASATPPPARAALVHQAIMPSFVLIQTDSGGETAATPQADATTAPDATPQPESTPQVNGTDAPNSSKDSHSLGSGVVVSEQGDILTSLHVVADATVITVTFSDGTESDAEIVNSQPEHDIAVLRASKPPAQLVPATLGNPQAMHVGDEVYAVGNPIGLYASLSSGVVSGLKRSFKPEHSDTKLEDLIQFDAAVNPGSSGGPLLNRYGQVIGIVAALVNPAGQDSFSGIGFAVPINTAGGAAGLPPY